MHDSIIKVERTTNTLSEGYAPIQFANLSAGEQTILATVTEEGGYGTCDTSDAFERFLNRVIEHPDRLGPRDMALYLERDGTYYQLYIEDLDQVFAH